MINKEVIAKLNPCKDRFDNFITHYGHKSFTKGQFMGLKNITHEDKIWVALRLLPKDKIRFAAADIAESVLHIFETKYPNDSRPRLALEAARGCNITRKVAYHAYDAAGEAAYHAYHAYDAAGEAAYHAAYTTSDAAAYAAADAARRSCRALPGQAQEKLVRKIILKYWKD